MYCDLYQTNLNQEKNKLVTMDEKNSKEHGPILWLQVCSFTVEVPYSRFFC